MRVNFIKVDERKIKIRTKIRIKWKMRKLTKQNNISDKTLNLLVQQ